jgi:anti-repressor protein
MNNLMNFEGNNVEIFEHKGDILFNPKHVAKCLDIKNVNDSVRNFNKKQVIKLKNSDIGNVDIRKLNNAGENFLTESGVYKLIFKSRKEEAERFQDWVTDEVLPSIRKHGAYMTEQTLENVLSNPDTLIRLATDLKKEREERQKLQLESKQKDKEIEVLKPLATYTERILQSTGLFTATQIGKDYGLSGQEFNKLLNQVKIQYKQNGQWLLYARYHDRGYTGSETIPIKHKDGRPDSKINTKWTQEGRLFLYEFLKVRGIVPKIEQGYKNEQITLIN